MAFAHSMPFEGTGSSLSLLVTECFLASESAPKKTSDSLCHHQDADSALKWVSVVMPSAIRNSPKFVVL